MISHSNKNNRPKEKRPAIRSRKVSGLNLGYSSPGVGGGGVLCKSMGRGVPLGR